jgi:transposase
MKQFKKEPKKFKVARNSLILHLVLQENMKLPNVAEEAGVSIATVKSVVRDSMKPDGNLANSATLER